MSTPYQVNCPPDNQREIDNNSVSQDNISWSTITFNLDDPEGERRLRECLDAPKVKAAVREYEGFLAGVIKRAESEPTRLCFQSARDQLFAIFNDCGLSPWGE